MSRRGPLPELSLDVGIGSVGLGSRAVRCGWRRVGASPGAPEQVEGPARSNVLAGRSIDHHRAARVDHAGGSERADVAAVVAVHARDVPVPRHHETEFCLEQAIHRAGARQREPLGHVVEGRDVAPHAPGALQSTGPRKSRGETAINVGIHDADVAAARIDAGGEPGRRAEQPQPRPGKPAEAVEVFGAGCAWLRSSTTAAREFVLASADFRPVRATQSAPESSTLVSTGRVDRGGGVVGDQKATGLGRFGLAHHFAGRRQRGHADTRRWTVRDCGLRPGSRAHCAAVVIAVTQALTWGGARRVSSAMPVQAMIAEKALAGIDVLDQATGGSRVAPGLLDLPAVLDPDRVGAAAGSRRYDQAKERGKGEGAQGWQGCPRHVSRAITGASCGRNSARARVGGYDGYDSCFARWCSAPAWERVSGR